MKTENIEVTVVVAGVVGDVVEDILVIVIMVIITMILLTTRKRIKMKDKKEFLKIILQKLLIIYATDVV